jgi:sterol desaturase/sphingolipid hydroxylase (fatty acid hydroxylase superfamily)
MSPQLAGEVAYQLAHTIWRVLPITLGLALVFALVPRKAQCNPSLPWWRKEGLVTDLCYWFFIPIFARFARIGLTVAITIEVLGIRNSDAIVRFYDNGHGPISALPFLVQCAIYLVVSDFFHYWAHRLFHQGWLWKYHAVHHSSEDLEWISAARFHPFNQLADAILIDVALLLAGISPRIFLIIGPFNVLNSALVHANLNWTFGPLKRIFASPVFHRWHHTLPDEGGEKNFAGTFSLFDVLFGTFYMPEGKLPERYGLADPAFPATFGPQVVYPLLSPKAASTDA